MDAQATLRCSSTSTPHWSITSTDVAVTRWYIAPRDGTEEHLVIPGVRAVNGRDAQTVASELHTARVVATSVGSAGLPQVLHHITAEAVRRALHNLPPQDIILAENIHGGGHLVRSAVEEAFVNHGLAERYRGTQPTARLPGVIECSVGKMVPIVPEELRLKEPTTVYAEPFNTLLVDARGWSASLPSVPELRPVEPIHAWVERKLYIHNLGHAAVAYLAFDQRPDLTYVWEAVSKPPVRKAARAAMEAAARGLAAEYPGVFTDDDLGGHIDDLLYRFGNRALGDTIHRVGRDIPRKLASSDRVVGALRLLQRHGLPTHAVEAVYRAAIHFRATDEAGNMHPTDWEFHRRLQASDDAATYLAAVSDFDLHEDAELLTRLTTDR